MRLQDKVVIVTGAASGIGQGIAVLFAKEGARIVAVDKNQQGVEMTARSIKQSGGDVLALTVDVSVPSEVETMVNQTMERHGRVDSLCNSAGLDHSIVPVPDLEVSLWDKVMDVNAKGSFLCAKYVIPQMIRGGGGAIVFIASDLGYVAVPGLGAYCASKGAVLQLTRVLAVENGKHNIRVNALCPTMIDTPMAQRTLKTHPQPTAWLAEIEAGTPLGRIGKVPEVAAAALFLVSEEASYITGACIPLDGGRTAQ